jgi:uncharacterized protein (DUF4415 family)
MEEYLDDQTVGRWRAAMVVHRLVADDKERNNDEVKSLARQHPTAQICVMANLASSWLENQFENVRRLSRDRINKEVVDWLRQSGLGWKENAEACSKKGSFTWTEISKWREQFKKIDPDKGLRVAAAILAQLKVVTINDMAEWFDGLEEVDYSLYYIGADPHSGDHTLVNILAHRIDGKKLGDVLAMPALSAQAKVRYFGDASWSGGEAERRIECMYTPCDKKPCALGPEQKLFVRFAYLTDVAEEALRGSISALEKKGRCSTQSVTISAPQGNLLKVDPTGNMMGLAFQDTSILQFVDPANPGTMRAICESIGKQINKNRPLGTDQIASTIAFEHSLPRAMLPLLIFGASKVKGHDGSFFAWKPLLTSQHVLSPAKPDKSLHCLTCPLVVTRPATVPSATVLAQPPSATVLPPS